MVIYETLDSFFHSIINNKFEEFREIVLKTQGACVDWKILNKLYLSYLSLSDDSRKTKYPDESGHVYFGASSVEHSNTKDGVNAFHMVLYSDSLVQEDKLQFLDMLVRHGRKVGYDNAINCFDFNSDTPLHLALKLRQYEVLYKLVNWGADVELCDAHGNNPYHHAAKSRQYKGLSIILGGLCERKVDFNRKNSKGETLLNMAESDPELNRILKIYKARDNIFKVALPVATMIFIASISIYFVIMDKHSNNFQIGKNAVLAVVVVSAAVIVSLLISLALLGSKLSSLDDNFSQSYTVQHDEYSIATTSSGGMHEEIDKNLLIDAVSKPSSESFLLDNTSSHVTKSKSKD